MTIGGFTKGTRYKVSNLSAALGSHYDDNFLWAHLSMGQTLLYIGFL